MRQCLGCGEHKPKKEMLRVLRTPDGNIELDFTGKKSGRGAYICPKTLCFKRARKNGRIQTALECSIPDEVYDRMERRLEDSDGELK